LYSKSKLQSLSESKLAVETHIRELEIDVVELPHIGSYTSMICRNCHVPGRRSGGNHGSLCKSPPCQSFISCGQKKKHPEQEKLAHLEKEMKQVMSLITSKQLHNTAIAAYQPTPRDN